MKTSLHKIGRVLIAGLVVFSNLFVLSSNSAVIKAQSIRQLPARIQIEDTPPDITISGGASRVVGTGDFNGDGVNDFLVHYQKVVGDLGTILFQKFGIVFGKRNQSQPVTINLATDEPDVSLTTGVKSPFGISYIAALGDLNRDGVDDIILTQERQVEIDKPRDRLHKIFFGSTGLQRGTIDLDALRPDLTIIPDRRAFAIGIAGTADVNADGVRDLLLTENGGYVSFALQILLGPFTAGETIDFNSQKPDVVIKSSNTIDYINNVYLADVNGDLATDVLVKKSRFDSRIGIYFTSLDVVFGSQNLKPGTEFSLSDRQPDATITAGFDFSVIQTGDVNGDGIDDVLIGNPTYYGEPAPPPWFSGSVRIVLGSRSMQGNVDQADVFIDGLPVPDQFQPVFRATFGDHLGESMKVGDINGDGVSDILIGAPGATTDKKGRIEYLSRTHIILGSTEIKRGMDFQTGRHQQDVTISFDSKTSGVGRQVGSNDFNGDGVSDILVGSDNDFYVFFGAQLRPPEITKAKYRKAASELSIFGTDLTGSARVEINGIIIDGLVTFDPDENKLALRGKKSELNLRNGKNEVVVIRRGARSNAIKLKV